MILTIEATDFNALKAKVIELAVGFGHDTSQVKIEIPTSELSSAEEPAKKSTRGRPKKVETPESIVATIAEATLETIKDFAAAEETSAIDIGSLKEEIAAIPVVETPAATRDDVRAALEALTGTKGMPAARALLQEFGAMRMSELKEADYDRFIQAAKA